MPTLLNRRPRRPGRRGVTLVEMLVVVALVILMMVILVQIFQSATGAMSASRTSTELDLVLRQIDGLIRSDLAGVTAKMTPPNDPKDKSGYFEYGENAPADAQGEDTDDYMAFTTKAPEGQYFTGRQWLSRIDPTTKSQAINQAIQPTTITSQVAEIVYFLRNGNLYRRVFLVAPERAGSINSGVINGMPNSLGHYQTTMFGGKASIPVSWQGMNDISCRPGSFVNGNLPIPNDLGDLTNRENRAFRPRFSGDPLSVGTGLTLVDVNGDGIPDYYPTLYYDGSGHTLANNDYVPNLQINESGVTQRLKPGFGFDVYAFPYIYPEMYSVSDPNRGALGALHYLAPNAQLNHAPLSLGDNILSTPGKQSWWGFPTWRETMAGLNVSSSNPGWTDPISSVAKLPNQQQPAGLQTLSTSPQNLLPPLGTFASAGVVSQLDFSDNAGSPPNTSLALPLSAMNFVAIPAAPTRIWEDDLVLTNVRSFDIKAYDLNAGFYNTPVNGYFSAGYLDLGYGANPYIPDPANPGKFLLGSYTGGPNGTTFVANQPAVPWQAVGGEPVGFGHEGRIPPLLGDYRMHPRRPFIFNNAGVLIPNNVGDPQVINALASPPPTQVNRLNRVFDTWSTDYTNAWDSDLMGNNSGINDPPIYPSFPPPYPSALRGIQVQIRVVDPRNERSKVLTIRHDFTDKLTD